MINGRKQSKESPSSKTFTQREKSEIEIQSSKTPIIRLSTLILLVTYNSNYLKSLLEMNNNISFHTSFFPPCLKTTKNQGGVWDTTEPILQEASASADSLVCQPRRASYWL